MIFNSRFVIYTEELDRILDTENTAIPTKLLYNLFDCPLQIESGESFNLIIVMLILFYGLWRHIKLFIRKTSWGGKGLP